MRYTTFEISVIVVIIFLFGLVIGQLLSSDLEITADTAVQQCEKSLPRDQRCGYNIETLANYHEGRYDMACKFKEILEQE